MAAARSTDLRRSVGQAMRALGTPRGRRPRKADGVVAPKVPIEEAVRERLYGRWRRHS